jgi:hypothetical protein
MIHDMEAFMNEDKAMLIRLALKQLEQMKGSDAILEKHGDALYVSVRLLRIALMDVIGQ